MAELNSFFEIAIAPPSFPSPRRNAIRMRYIYRCQNSTNGVGYSNSSTTKRKKARNTEKLTQRQNVPS